MTDGDGHTLPLKEWVALSAFLERQQSASSCAASRQDAMMPYVGRSTVVSLLIVDKLRSGSLDLGKESLSIDRFALDVGVDCSDRDNLKESPELLLQVLESVKNVGVASSNNEIQPGESAGGDEGNSRRGANKSLYELGVLLYQVFSRGDLPPTSANSVGPGANGDVIRSREKEGGDDDEEEEEYPGAEKGRSKRFIRDTCKSFRRLHISNLEESMTELGLPLSISTLLEDLIEPPDDVHAPMSFEDVYSELEQILQRPNVYLVDNDGHLNFGESVLGRDQEVACLLEAATQMQMRGEDTPRTNALVLIGGEPGVGKSSLVESVRDSLMENGWIYLDCKFDRLMRAQPLSTIASAFEKFFRQVARIIADGGGDSIGPIVASVERSVSASGIVALSDLIPSLHQVYPQVFSSIIGDYDSSSQSSGGEEGGEVVGGVADAPEDQAMVDDEIISSAEARKNRLHYLFRRLVHAISSPEHPLIFFIDDWQWIDESSIEVLSSILTDSDRAMNEGGYSQCLLVVGAFRSGEVDESHLLQKYLREFEESDAVVVSNLPLGPISKLDVNALVSDALGLSERRTKRLSDIVHAKTLGNPLFLQVFLKSLLDDNILSFSLARKRWVWDIEAVQAASIDENVAELMARKLRRLPVNVQNALKAASCFGVQVDDNILSILSESEEFSDIVPCLEQAREDGILAKENTEQCSYRFAHDIVQAAAYGELMSQDERSKLHYDLGVVLILAQDSQQFNPVTFAAADQINMATSINGSMKLTGDAMIEFAWLNLTAGERCQGVSDFASSIGYLSKGISFLPDTRWETDYELSLRLHLSSALACYVTGNHDLLKTFLTDIMENANSFDDKLKGLFVLVQSITSLGKLADAINRVFVILEQLGEKIPTEVTPANVQEVLLSTKKTLAEYSKEDIMNSPRLTNERKRWALKFMAFIMPYIYMVKPIHFPVICCRMINIFLEHGVCSEAAFGFSGYSLCLIFFLREIALGYKWCKLSLALLQSLNLSLCPKMKILSLHMNYFWVEPLQSTAAELLQTHQEALMAGDIESAALGAHFYTAQSIFTGTSLPDLEKQSAALTMEMVNLKQFTPCIAHLCNHQTLLSLLGSKENPFLALKDLLGIGSESEALEHAKLNGRSSLASNISCNHLFLAVFFKRFEEAAEIAANYIAKSVLKDVEKVFYEGVTAFHFARKRPSESKWMVIGKQALMSFREWTTHSNWNWENKCLILEAEQHFARGDLDFACEKYKAALESSRRHRFVHEEGLCNELFAAFHRARGDVDEAERCIADARACYEKWGAKALVKLLDQAGQDNHDC